MATSNRAIPPLPRFLDRREVAVRLSMHAGAILLAGLLAGFRGDALEERFAPPGLSSNWSISTWNHAAPTGGLSHVAFLPSQVAIGNDGLVLTLQRTSDRPGIDYLGGRLFTRGSFRYGHVEVTARLPEGGGTWPAIWLRTPEGPPLNGEIDLVEGFGADARHAQSTVHYWANGRHLGYKCAIFGIGEGPKAGADRRCQSVRLPAAVGDLTGFHRYGLEWTPKEVVWSLDGKPYYRISDSIPDRPMALVLNLAANSPFDRGGKTDQPVAMVIKSVSIQKNQYSQEFQF